MEIPEQIVFPITPLYQGQEILFRRDPRLGPAFYGIIQGQDGILTGWLSVFFEDYLDDAGLITPICCNPFLCRPWVDPHELPHVTT